MRTHPRWRLPDFTSTNGEEYPSSRNDRGKDRLLAETPCVGTHFLLNHDHQWVSAICLLFLFLLFFFFLLLLLYGIVRNAQTSTASQHEIVSFVCSIQNVGERRPEESLEMNMERLQPQLSYQPPGKSSGGCYSAHYSTVHLGHMFAIYMPFISQWIGWIMSCLSERKYLIGTWHLTLLQIDVREFCCLFDLPLMFSSELSDLKVSLCTNLSGKKPSRWTWAIQSFKELSLSAVHRWWTSRRSYVFVRCWKSYHTIAPSKSCETCVSMGTRYSCKYVQLKFLPSSYLIWSWIFQRYWL